LDKQQIGQVSKAHLLLACNQSGVTTITKDDINRLVERYGTAASLIDYTQMSKDMGLHLASFNLIYKSTKRKENIERLRKVFAQRQNQNPQANPTDALQSLLQEDDFQSNDMRNPLDRLIINQATKRPKTVAGQVGHFNGPDGVSVFDYEKANFE
jgi:PIN domain nuclease of toxin-antitoxin system